MVYRLVVKNKAGETLGEFENYSGLKFNRYLNNYGSIEFRLPANDPKLQSLVALRQYEVYLYRDNLLLTAGEQALRGGRLAADSPNFVTITCFDWLELLNHRITAPFRRFENVDAGMIAWTMIDESQGLTDGDFGITQGAIQPTKPRDREYQSKNIMEAIIQLTEVIGGFDFEITPDKVFNVYERKGLDRSNQFVFEWGTNFREVGVVEDFSRPCNQAIVLGEGFGETQAMRVRTDVAAREIHGLRQQRVSYVDVSQDDTLDDKGDAVTRKHKQAVLSLGVKMLPAVDPVLGSLSIGDTVRVRLKDGFYNIDNRFRIYGYNVSVSEDNEESVEYFISNQ